MDGEPWLHFGHSDMSAVPIVDEAVYWGFKAADGALRSIPKQEENV